MSNLEEEPHHQRKPEDFEFEECAACSAKTGTPTLCRSCRTNRTAIDQLKRIIGDERCRNCEDSDEFLELARVCYKTILKQDQTIVNMAHHIFGDQTINQPGDRLMSKELRRYNRLAQPSLDGAVNYAKAYVQMHR